MPTVLTTSLRHQALHAQRAYLVQARQIVAENDDLVASSAGLILESRALLLRVDRMLCHENAWDLPNRETDPDPWAAVRRVVRPDRGTGA